MSLQELWVVSISLTSAKGSCFISSKQGGHIQLPFPEACNRLYSLGEIPRHDMNSLGAGAATHCPVTFSHHFSTNGAPFRSWIRANVSTETKQFKVEACDAVAVVVKS